jgi:hypothetical protein
MKSLPALLLCAPLLAHASWFDYEAGIGVARSADMGDGTWYQEGASHHEDLTTPGFLAGLTGDIGEHVSWHADYVYTGQISAGCVCVPDAAYNVETHTIISSAHTGTFNGFGHTQGLALTLEPHVDTHGWRFGVEAGPWLYWATWHETLVDMSGAQTNASHHTHLQFGWTAGASVAYKSVSLSYRYYSASPSWNPYPGLVTGTHMLTLTKRF